MKTLSSEEFRLLIRVELMCWLGFNFGMRQWRDRLIEEGVVNTDQSMTRWMLHDTEGTQHRKIEKWAREHGFRSRYDVQIEEDDPFWARALEVAAERTAALPSHKGKASEIYGPMPYRYQDTKELMRRWIPHDGGKFVASMQSMSILEDA